MTHIYVGSITIIGSNNSLSLDRRHVIFGVNARILLIRPLGTHLNRILIKVLTFSFNKMHLKMQQRGHFVSDVVFVVCINMCGHAWHMATKYIDCIKIHVISSYVCRVDFPNTLEWTYLSHTNCYFIIHSLLHKSFLEYLFWKRHFVQ